MDHKRTISCNWWGKLYLNIGIRLKIIVHSLSQHSTRWWLDWKLFNVGGRAFSSAQNPLFTHFQYNLQCAITMCVVCHYNVCSVPLLFCFCAVGSIVKYLWSQLFWGDLELCRQFVWSAICVCVCVCVCVQACVCWIDGEHIHSHSGKHITQKLFNIFILSFLHQNIHCCASQSFVTV